MKSIRHLLWWDENVNLPPKSTGSRSEQSAVFEEILSREASNPRIGELIDTLETEKNNLSSDQKAILREARRDYDLATRIPVDLATRFARAKSLASQAWVEASERILGLTPNDHREGVLQDIHWANAMFGYFPSYLLGTMIGAQIWHKILKDIPGLPAEIESGNFQPLVDWLRTNVHSKGRRQYTQEFVKEVTGSEFSCDYLIKFLESHYLPLYQQV